MMRSDSVDETHVRRDSANSLADLFSAHIRQAAASLLDVTVVPELFQTPIDNAPINQ